MLSFNGLSSEFRKELSQVASDKVISADELTRLKEIANSDKGNKKDQEFLEFLESKKDQEHIQFKAPGTGSSNSAFNLVLDESNTPDKTYAISNDDFSKRVELNLIDSNNDITDGYKRLEVKYIDHMYGSSSFDTTIFYDSRVGDFNDLAKGKAFTETYKKNGVQSYAINFKGDFSSTLEKVPTPVKPHNIKDSTGDKVPSVSEKVADLQAYLNERLPSGQETPVNGIFGANTMFALGKVYTKALQEGDRKTIETLKPLIDKLAKDYATADNLEPGHQLSFALKELSDAGNKVTEASTAFEHAYSMAGKAIESAEKGDFEAVARYKKAMYEKAGSEDTMKLIKSSGAYRTVFNKLQEKLEAVTDKFVISQYLGEDGKQPQKSFTGTDGKVNRVELEKAKMILKSESLSYSVQSQLQKKIDQIDGMIQKEEKEKWDASEREHFFKRSKVNTFSDSNLMFEALDDTAGVGFMNKQNPRLSVAVLQVAAKAELIYPEIQKMSTEQARNLVRHIIETDLSPGNRKLAQDILFAKPQLLNPQDDDCLKQDEINKIKNGPAASSSINPKLFSEALKEALTFPANDEVAKVLMKSIIYGDVDPKAAFSSLSDGDLKDLVELAGEFYSMHQAVNIPGATYRMLPDKDILMDKIRQAGRSI